MADIRAELTGADWFILNMVSGSQWEPGATLILPSGITLTGDQVAALLPAKDGNTDE